MASGAAVGAAGHASDALAQAATEGEASVSLQEVVVTGSRIPRTVDQATASPITTIDQTAISQSGFTTTGDLVQQLPGISGSATTAGTNNGGGFGESTIELRGLKDKRTLILLDGRRIGVFGGPGASGAVDVNQIPLNIIDHVDVLKEGAGAIYGSDAIAGVVNFVTRKGVNDLEINGEAGATTHGFDGGHQAVNLLWGGSSDKFDFLVSGSYTKQKAVYAAARQFSKHALYLYSGTAGRSVYSAGSSRVPNGRASLPAGALVPGTTTGQTLRGYYGCSTVYRTPGTDGTALADYTCPRESYNYQPFNLITTPAERGALFTSASYKITDELEAYTEITMNKTHSGFEIAPLPFDATADNVVISGANEYNPFGVDFGGLNTTNSNYRTRFVTLGDRKSQADTDTKLINVGLRGPLPFGNWKWDLNLGYNREDQQEQVFGYVYFPGLQNEVGPSFANADGTFGCGTDAAHAVPGCTPINFFDLNSPQTISQLSALSTSYHDINTFVYKSAALDLNGALFPLPAGDLQTAIGFQYESQQAQYSADYIVQAQAPLYISCLISEEACTGNSGGSYNSKEFYAEAFVPILKDLPGVKTLNLDLGVRYSDYSLFGKTTKGQFKLEYKPVSDLLVRGTFSQVFRVPTLIDLYAAPLNTSVNYADPCYGSTAASVASNPNLATVCNGAYQLGGTYGYNGTAQVTGLILSNPNLKPETGHVWTYGFVLQIPGVENLSITADVWRYDINNIITQLDPNYSSQQCIATGAPEFCNLIHRFQTGNNQGEMEVFFQPNVNLGELKTDGVDYDIAYKLNKTFLGSFRFDLSATYTDKFLSVPLPGAAPTEVAGTYNKQFGNYAKWRALSSVAWSRGPFEGMVQLQMINSEVLHDPATQNEALFGMPDPDLQIPRIFYLNATLGYTVKPTNTKVQFGMQNINNRQPPLLYQNNVINANTDVSTYDLLGRRFFFTINQKF
ncbi:MAG TPA: TonB-dependent receptor [Steroidobacteraceae bacterium]|nr:TonB-dependent receptor [Steroidobacteraceae bacterium]